MMILQQLQQDLDGRDDLHCATLQIAYGIHSLRAGLHGGMYMT